MEMNREIRERSLSSQNERKGGGGGGDWSE